MMSGQRTDLMTSSPASGLSNGQADMSYHLAVALSRNGKTDAARRSLEEVLAGNGKFANRAAAEALLARL